MKCTTCGQYGHTSDKCNVPVHKTARARARQWFKTNPGEYITLTDMVERFGFPNEANAKQTVYYLKMEGLVRSEHVVFADPDRPRV